MLLALEEEKSKSITVILASESTLVVEHLIQNPQFEGSKPDAACIGGRKQQKRHYDIDQGQYRNCRTIKFNCKFEDSNTFAIGS